MDSNFMPGCIKDDILFNGYVKQYFPYLKQMVNKYCPKLPDNNVSFSEPPSRNYNKYWQFCK